MQYVGRAFDSVANTWNSLNPATLSGASDVIVVEQESGDLACSPFHIRFGKFSLLRPSEKKVLFQVNGEKADFAMKVGEGGEAFFVFQTEVDIPQEMQTSPVISPLSSPRSLPGERRKSRSFPIERRAWDTFIEPDFLDLNRSNSPSAVSESMIHQRAKSEEPEPVPRPHSGDWFDTTLQFSTSAPSDPAPFPPVATSNGRPRSPQLSTERALERAESLSQKFVSRDIPTQITDTGDLYLDMNGYKAGKEETEEAIAIARRILAEEVQHHEDLESLIGADQRGNLWIYASEETKEDAVKRHSLTLNGYDSGSDDAKSEKNTQLSTPPSTPPLLTKSSSDPGSQSKTYAKTLRLTSDQLKSLKLKPGSNAMSFSVNDGRSICTANLFYWNHDTPVVLSDIDGTITKSDALGHVLTMIGRDWTHAGVAKLYTDIVDNGYHMLYLTSRSVGQADVTRAYLKGIEQNRYRLPEGPVIMSPDRTMAALRREIYLRKPEVFKMACLRDIKKLFGDKNPFYAGFGNRITDALSYRSVNVPSSRIFTINSNAEVRLELLELTGYKSSYIHIGDLVDYFFPPVAMHVADESYTDFLYWREPIATLSEDELDDDEADVSRQYGSGDDNDSHNSDDDEGFV